MTTSIVYSMKIILEIAHNSLEDRLKLHLKQISDVSNLSSSTTYFWMVYGKVRL